MRQARAAASSSSSSAPSGGGEMHGIDAPIEVRRHPGARRMTLRVSRTRRAVIVTVPVQCNLDDANTFLSRNLDWVRERLVDLPSLSPLGHGSELPLRGEMHRLEFTGAERRRGSVGAGPVTRIVAATEETAPGEPAMPVLSVGGRPEHAARRLGDWLFDEARRDLDVAVQRHARALGLSPKRIVVRDQTSRWGSCSTTRVLSFSWRLVMAPPSILDYVAAHEVAHLAEMNHGPRFWALVERTFPRMEDAKRWLTVYGVELHRYTLPRG